MSECPLKEFSFQKQMNFELGKVYGYYSMTTSEWHLVDNLVSFIKLELFNFQLIYDPFLRKCK